MDRSWWRSSAGAVKVNSVCEKWNLTSNLANVQADHTSETAREGIVIGLPLGTMTSRDAKKMTQTNLTVGVTDYWLLELSASGSGVCCFSGMTFFLRLDTSLMTGFEMGDVAVA